MSKISHIRNDYGQTQLQRPQLKEDPIEQFEEWLHDAINKEATEPTAMCLSTVDAEGMPQSRIVLLKDVTNGGFTFFTNYLSAKGEQIANHAKVALNFFWPELERQVRITGTAEKTSPEVSDDYFFSRPPASKLGAWASPQSRTVDEGFVLKEFEKLAEQYTEQPISRPPHWGGYMVTPATFEFWQGRSNRLHDRFKYKKNQIGQWQIARLAP